MMDISFINIKSFCFNLHFFIEIDPALVYRFTNAARVGDVIKIVEMLHDRMPVDSVDEFGFMALMRAAIYNRTDVIRALLQRGADVNRQSDVDGSTAIHMAAFNNSIDVIRILMQHEAAAKVENNYGRTPVGLARMWNYEEAVRIMKQY